MNSPTALIVSTSRTVKRRVTRALASAGFAIEQATYDWQEVCSRLAERPAICVVDGDEERAKVERVLELLFAEHPDVIALLLAHDRDAFILDLLSNRNLNNLIAKHGALSNCAEIIDENELIVTCQKLFRRDIFGLEKYLPAWGVQIHEREITESADKDRILADLDDFLRSIDCYGAIKSAVSLVADELVMNSVFNAPRDASGAPKYANIDRGANLRLEPHERARFRYGCDGRNVALSVIDQFGSLDRDVIVNYLKRCFTNEPAVVEEKAAGAGLGLYMVFNSITQLTFNIHAGVATEVIAIFYVRSGSRAFRSAGRSLNLFLLQ